MGLPYENATSGNRAIDEIERLLSKFGCSKFATGRNYETGDVFVQFEHRGRPVHLTASAQGYAAAWLKQNPYNHRHRCTKREHEQRALRIGHVAVYSILRDWVKAQITVIEIGAMSFEAAFLSHIVLESGHRVIDVAQTQNLLPAGDVEGDRV